MPQKPLEWRKKLARRQGAARRLKPIELKGVSPHAAKKSRYAGMPAAEEARTVGERSPPHKGHAGREKFERPTQVPASDRRRAAPVNSVLEPHRLQKTTVRGRKKPPSQMHLKREGGPHKRSPLHGG